MDDYDNPCIGYIKEDSGKRQAKIKHNNSVIQGLQDLDFAQSIFKGNTYRTKEFADKNVALLLKNKQKKDKLKVKNSSTKSLFRQTKAKKWRPLGKGSVFIPKKPIKFKKSLQLKSYSQVKLIGNYKKKQSFYSKIDELYPTLKVFGNPKPPIYFDSIKKQKGRRLLSKGISRERLEKSFETLYMPKKEEACFSIAQKKAFERRQEINSYVDLSKFKPIPAVYRQDRAKRRNTLRQIDLEVASDMPADLSDRGSELLKKCNKSINSSINILDKSYENVSEASFLMKNTVSLMVQGKDYMLEHLLAKQSKKMFKKKGCFSYDKGVFISKY